ncbi:MAG: hypothetical protein AB7P14_28665, partial [Blastocatellales bacterium]
DPSIVSFTTSGSNYNANGLLAGFTLTEASALDVYYFDDGMDCYSTYITYTDPGEVRVKPTISGPSEVWNFTNVGSPNGNYPIQITLTAQPSNVASYVWTLSTGQNLQ